MKQTFEKVKQLKGGLSAGKAGYIMLQSFM